MRRLLRLSACTTVEERRFERRVKRVESTRASAPEVRGGHNQSLTPDPEDNENV